MAGPRRGSRGSRAGRRRSGRRRGRRRRGRSRRPGRARRGGAGRRGRRRPRCRCRPRGRRGRRSSPTTRRRWRPRAAARTSFSTTHGRRGAPRGGAAAAGPCQPRLTARVTSPVSGSTRPGTPTPTAATSSARRAGVGEGVVDDRGDLVGGAVRVAGRGRGDVARPGRAVASTTRTAILLPPMSTPTRSGRLGGRRAGRRRRRSSMHRQAELAGEQQRARAEERQVLADPAVDDLGSRARAVRGCGGGPRRGSPSSHGSPRRGDRAVEDDLADVEDADQAGDRRRRAPGRRRASTASARLVAGASAAAASSASVSACEAGGRGGAAAIAGRAGDRLEAAEPAAVALARRRARRRRGRSRRRRSRRPEQLRRRGRGRHRCRARP